MLDLFRNRESAMRTLLVVLLSLVALSMVVTLIPGFGSPSLNTDDDQVLAVIGDDKVMARDIRARIDELVRGQRLPPQLVSAYVPQLIDGAIEERAEALMSKMLGNQVTDDELARVIQGSLPNLFDKGQVDKARYREAVASMGRSIPQFEEDLRKNQLGLRVRNMAEESAIVSPADVEAEFRRRNVKLKIDYVSFSAEKLKSSINPSEADMRALYENGKSNYPIPEKRSIIALVADENQIASQIETPEAMLRAAYDRNKESFRAPARVKARHILVMTQGKPESEKPALKKKAEDLLKQVKGGADFAEVAKKNSDDQSNASKGGDLDWFVREKMVPAFSDAAFALKPGQTSDIVTTEFGYHIIHVDDKEEAKLKPFEEVKGQLTADLKRGQVLEMTQKTIENARAEVIKDPKQIEAIGGKYKLQVIKADNIGVNDPLPSLGQAVDLVSAAFSLKPGGVTPVIQPQTGKLAIATLESITAARVATFEEARDRIKDSFQQIKAQELAQTKAKEAAEKLLAPGADWKAVAKSIGAELKTSPEFGPDGSIEGLGGAAMLGDLLNKPVGASAGPISIVGQWAVARIAERIEPDPAQLANTKVSVQLNLKQKASQQRYSLIRDSILHSLIEKGKVKKNKKAIERLLASYTS
jgi:peptidyl-prolyl cis-trans isomerase D